MSYNGALFYNSQSMSPEELAKVKTAFANIEEKVKSGKITTQEEFDADEDVNSIRFSVNRNDASKETPIQYQEFANKVDKVFSGVIKSNEGNIDVSQTPDILKKYGAVSSKITISPNTMYKIAYPEGYMKGKHNLGIPALKRLPEQIAGPLAIMKSNTQEGSLVLLTEWNDTKGNPVIIPIHINKQGAVELENEVASAYGTPSKEIYKNILYTKNNESIHQILSNRLQLPDAVSDDTLVNWIISRGGATVNDFLSLPRNNADTVLQITGTNENARSFGKTQKKFFDAFGVEVVMDESLDANAEVLLDDGVVKVSPYADIDDWKITRHEFTHLLKALAPDAYELYARLAREEMGDRWDKHYAEAKRDYTAYYEKKGKEVTDNLIKEEVLARYAEGLDNNDFIRKVARESTSVAVKVRNILKRIVDKIKAVFSSGERAGTPENIKKIITAKDAWENAAIEAAKSKGRVVSGGSRESIRLTENDLGEYLHAGTRRNPSKQRALSEGKKIILCKESEITAFIRESIRDADKLNTIGYGRVNERLSNDVNLHSEGKVNIDGNFLELVPYDIHHAHREHLKAKEPGDIDLSMKDFENIPSYIDQYDEIVYVRQYESGNTRICLSKKLPNGRVLIIETVSKSRGSIAFKNMIGVSEEKYNSEYKKRNSTNTRGSKSSNISLHNETASKSIIHNESENVNSKLSVPRNERTDSFRWDLFNREMKFLRGLESENAHLKEVNDILKRFFRQTAMVHVDALHISEYAEHIKKVYETHMPAKEIATELQRIYTKMAEDGARAPDIRL